MPIHTDLDWGTTGHTIYVVDERGAVLARFVCSHAAHGVADLLTRSARIAVPANLPVGIDRPSRLLGQALLAASPPVVPIHPNVAKACRSRDRAAGAKSDPGDAFMIADILRTDCHRFWRLSPCSDEIKALHALARGRDDLVAADDSLADQLCSLLDGFWHRAGGVFTARAELTSRIEHTLAESLDGRIDVSSPSGGRVNAAPILAEFGELRGRFHTEDQLAAEASVCLVTHASGKTRDVIFRFT